MFCLELLLFLLALFSPCEMCLKILLILHKVPHLLRVKPRAAFHPLHQAELRRERLQHTEPRFATAFCEMEGLNLDRLVAQADFTFQVAW